MSKKFSFAWMAWFVASIFYAYQYIIRVMPSIMMPDIMNQFHIDAAVFGQFSGVYYIGYSLIHLPVGIMLDRYGPRKVMTGCILLTILGLMPIIFAENWVYPIIGRAFIGMGSSAAILGAFKIIRMLFDERHFTRMLSFSVTIGLAGAIYGGAPISYLCDVYGYQWVVSLMAIMGGVLAAITFAIVPEIPATREASVWSSVKTVLTNKKVILICLSAGLMVGPLEGFADVWGATFLKQVYGMDGTIANSLPSMIFMGMCFGAPILSYIAEKSDYYLGTIIGSGIVMAGVFALLIAQSLNISSIMMSFILVGVCSAYQIIAIYKASTFVPENVAGLTTAVANMIIMSFGYAFHSIIGGIVNAYGGTTHSAALIYGISSIPIALVLGIMGFMTVASARSCSKKEAII